MFADPLWKRALRLAKGAGRKCLGHPSALDQARWINRFGRAGYEDLALETPLRADSFVMDIGAYCGDWSAAVHARHGCRIWMFEPVRQFYEEAKARFAGNSQCRVFHFGLAGKNETARISLSGVASSVYGGEGAMETIQLRDIAVFFLEHGIQSVDCMAMNIEGGEFDLLERMIETRLTNRCAELHIQFHRVAPEAERRRAAIREKLAKTHENTLCYPFVWEIWRRKNALHGKEDAV